MGRSYFVDLRERVVAVFRGGMEGKTAGYYPQRLVFVDETWTKTNMAPLRGWAKVGQRLIGKAPHGHRKTLTFVAALRCDGIHAP